eukprot:121732-Prymnesium_polylepis.1
MAVGMDWQDDDAPDSPDMDAAARKIQKSWFRKQLRSLLTGGRDTKEGHRRASATELDAAATKIQNQWLKKRRRAAKAGPRSIQPNGNGGSLITTPRGSFVGLERDELLKEGRIEASREKAPTTRGSRRQMNLITTPRACHSCKEPPASGADSLAC